MKDLNPWFVVTVLLAIAKYPIGARELNRTDPFGICFSDAAFKPLSVTSSSPFAMNLLLPFSDTSFGVIQGFASFEKYSSTSFDGVLPPTISPKQSKVPHSQPAGISLFN